MAKFSTYVELNEHFPSVEAVTRVRDSVIEFIDENDPERIAAVYGSSVWSFHRNCPDQHKRRSDIDVALSPRAALYPEIIHPLMTRCAQLQQETGVRVEITPQGARSPNGVHYQGLISPSTADHFYLLSKAFRQVKPFKGRYAAFMSVMRRATRDRVEDMRNYLYEIRSHLQGKEPGGMRSTPIFDLSDPSDLEKLCKLENLPAHLMRKALGMEKLLPVPDSKTRVKTAFDAVAYRWPFRERLSPRFDEMAACTREYEQLIDEVAAGLGRHDYERRFRSIADSVVRTGSMILAELSGSSLHEMLEITRIPKGAPVIILNHYKPGEGSVYAQRLSKPFGSLRNGVQYQTNTIARRIHGHEESLPVYHWSKDLLWIEDPFDQARHWFHFQPAGSMTRVSSIRACDEDLYEHVRAITDSERPGYAREAERSLYREYAAQALCGRSVSSLGK